MSTSGKVGLHSSSGMPRSGRRREAPRTQPSDAVTPVQASPEAVPRRIRRVEARNAAILDAALVLFSRLGLHGTTVDQIAEAADVSKTNLFYYFASKEEIYLAVLRRLLEVWLAPLRAIEADLDPIDAIRGYIRSKVAFSRSNPEASRLFCLEIVQGAPLIGPELRSSLKELVDAKAAIIEAWSRQGRLAAVDPHHLIFAIWSTTQHYADFAEQVAAVVGKRLSDDDFCDQVVANIQQIIVSGIQPLPPGSPSRPQSQPHAAPPSRGVAGIGVPTDDRGPPGATAKAGAGPRRRSKI